MMMDCWHLDRRCGSHQGTLNSRCTSRRDHMKLTRKEGEEYCKRAINADRFTIEG